MSYMFSKSIFDGNISKWNISNVIDMFYVLIKSKFNSIYLNGITVKGNI